MADQRSEIYYYDFDTKTLPGGIIAKGVQFVTTEIPDCQDETTFTNLLGAEDDGHLAPLIGCWAGTKLVREIAEMGAKQHTQKELLEKLSIWWAQARALFPEYAQQEAAALAAAIKLVEPDHPALWTKAQPVSDINKEVIPLVGSMRRLMWDAKGVGLAAPQIGRGLRFFVSDEDGMKTVINPAIIEFSPERTSRPEGCLTWPGRTTFVPRHEWIVALWTDLKGEKIRRRLTGLQARIFQHETDHLDGICIFGQ